MQYEVSHPTCHRANAKANGTTGKKIPPRRTHTMSSTRESIYTSEQITRLLGVKTALLGHCFPTPRCGLAQGPFPGEIKLRFDWPKAGKN